MKFALRSLFAVIAVLPAPALASDFSDFRIPDHSWHSVQLDATGRFDRYDSNSLPGSGRSSRWGATMSADGNWGYDSEKLARSLGLIGRFEGTRFHQESDQTILLDPLNSYRRVMDGKSKVAHEFLDASASFRFYPWSHPLALGLGAGLRGDFSQDWSNIEQETSVFDTVESRTLSQSASERSTDNQVVSYQATVGYGRVRDASGIFQAYLLVARLQRAGVLGRPLSEEARRRLANVFFLQQDYEVAHDRSDKFFWRDVVEILRDDGAIADAGLDAYGLLTALESERPSGTSRYIRRAGFYLGAAIEGRHQRSFGRNSMNSYQAYVSDTLTTVFQGDYSRKSTVHDDQVYIGADAQWSRPIGYKSQVDLGSRLRIPTRDLNAIDFSNSAVFDQVISDRWEARVALAHRRGSLELFGGRLSLWSFTASADLYYYIEDRMRLSLHLADGQQNDEEPSHRYVRERAVLIGITYFLTRGLDAPGTIDPQRMLPKANPLY